MIPLTTISLIEAVQAGPHTSRYFQDKTGFILTLDEDRGIVSITHTASNRVALTPFVNCAFVTPAPKPEPEEPKSKKAS